MNLPNQLTMARIGLCALFVVSMSIPWPLAATTALVIFGLASLTDLFDGLLARRLNLITDLGKLLDPLADKILISAAFISLIERGIVPMWMAVTIIAREFLITGLRIIAANKHLILAAERAGKHKTITQIVTILTSLSYLSLGEFNLGHNILADVLKASLPPLLWITVFVTVASGALYFYKNRFLFDRIEESASAPLPATPTPSAPVSTHTPETDTKLFPAFKEWAVITEALGRGEQMIILRKGGIAEGREGFNIKHHRFWLFPTQYHQQLDKAKPAANAFSSALTADKSTIVLRYFAEITDVRFLDDWSQVASLDNAHLWREDLIRERFQYGGENGIHLIVVRVRRLAHPYTLPADPAYDGCKSWIDVPADFETESSAAVIADEEFNTRRGQLLARIGATSAHS